MKGDPASAAQWEEGGGNSEEETIFMVSDPNFCPEQLDETTISP